MEYPKNWEAEVAGWVDAPEEDADYIVVDSKDGQTVHKVKNINWLATARANRKKLIAALAAVTAVLAAAAVLVRLLRRKD